MDLQIDTRVFDYCNIEEYTDTSGGLKRLLAAHNVSEGVRWVAMMNRFERCKSNSLNSRYNANAINGYFYAPRLARYCEDMGASSLLLSTRVMYPLTFRHETEDKSAIIDGQIIHIDVFGLSFDGYSLLKRNMGESTTVSMIAKENPMNYLLFPNVELKLIAVVSLLALVCAFAGIGLLYIDTQYNQKANTRNNRRYRGIMLIISFSGSLLLVVIPWDPLGFTGALGLDLFFALIIAEQTMLLLGRFGQLLLWLDIRISIVSSTLRAPVITSSLRLHKFLVVFGVATMAITLTTFFLDALLGLSYNMLGAFQYILSVLVVVLANSLVSAVTIVCRVYFDYFVNIDLIDSNEGGSPTSKLSPSSSTVPEVHSPYDRTGVGEATKEGKREGEEKSKPFEPYQPGTRKPGDPVDSTKPDSVVNPAQLRIELGPVSGGRSSPVGHRANVSDVSRGVKGSRKTSRVSKFLSTDVKWNVEEKLSRITTLMTIGSSISFVALITFGLLGSNVIGYSPHLIYFLLGTFLLCSLVTRILELYSLSIIILPRYDD